MLSFDRVGCYSFLLDDVNLISVRFPMFVELCLLILQTLVFVILFNLL